MSIKNISLGGSTYFNGVTYGYTITTQTFTLGSQGEIYGNGIHSSVAGVTLLNQGVITPFVDFGADGVFLSAGGTVTNASSGIIRGAEGYPGGGIFGPEAVSQSPSGPGGNGGAGVFISGDATVINNGAIAGGRGGFGYYGGNGGAGVDIAGTLTNNGTIQGGDGGVGAAFADTFGGTGGYGVRVFGTVTNGATIQGGNGGTAFYFGGQGGYGVAATGTVTNTGMIQGGNGGSAALFGGRGGAGVGIDGALANSGTIRGGAGGSTIIFGGTGGAGVYLANGGTVTNNAGGLIQGGAGFYGPEEGGSGGAGIFDAQTGTVSNSGTILGGQYGGAFPFGGFSGRDGDGVDLNAGGLVTNSGTGALIEGKIGVFLDGAGTVVNYGTIASFYRSRGTALLFGGKIQKSAGQVSMDGQTGLGVLVVEAGSTLVGAAYGGLGTLVLDSVAGAGTLSGLGEFGGILDFATDQVVSGATWTLTGSNYVGSYATLTNSGTLIDAGGLTNGGSIDGAITVSAGAYLQNNPGGTISATDTAVVSAGRVINFGAIEGGTNSVELTSSNGVLLMEGGATLSGTALGDGGMLEFGVGGSQPGTISGLGSGSSYSGFGSYLIDPGAYWTLAGAGTVTNGTSLTNEGTLSIGAPLTDSGLVTNVGVINGNITVTANGVLLIEAGSTISGAAVSSGGTLEFGSAGGSGTITGLGSGSTYSGFGSYLIDTGADWTLAGTGTVASGSTLTNNGTLTTSAPLIDSGLVTNASVINGNVTVSASGVLEVEAGSTITGTAMSSGGTLEFGSAGGPGTISGLGSGTVTGSALGTFTGFSTYLVETGANWTLTGPSTTVGGSTLLVAGTLHNSGSLTGAVTLTQGGVVTNDQGKTWNITQNVDVAVISGKASVNNYGLLEKTGGTGLTRIAAAVFNGNLGTIQVASGTLDFTGGAILGGTVGGAGTLMFGGGMSLLNPGANVTVANLALSGGSLKLGQDLSYGGAFTETGGSLNLGGHLLTLSGNNKIANMVGGSGTLTFGGGTTALNLGTTLQMTELLQTAGTVTLGTSLAYAGSFLQTGGTLKLGGKNLTLSGDASLWGTVTGAGKVYGKAATTLAGLTLTGGAVFWNMGTAIQTETATLGNAGGGSGTLVNDPGHTWNITEDVDIAVASGGTGTLLNRGVFEKTGSTGVTHVGAGVTNVGTIEVASGTLDFTSGVGSANGTTGSLLVAGATSLELDGKVSPTQTVNFTGTGGTLALGSAATFMAKVSGFDSTSGGSGDAIDLLGFSSSGATATFTQANHHLTVTNGGMTRVINLFGQYSNSFNVADDTHGGSIVTYSGAPSSQPIQIAAAH